MDFYEERKKRVLIFSLAYVPFVGGAELAVKEITDRISGFEFDLITLRFDKKWAKREMVGNVNVYRIGGGKMLFPLLAFCKACWLHKKNKYSAAWSIMANRAGFATLFFKIFFPKVKFLLTLQEGDTEDYPEKRMGILNFFLKPVFKKVFTKADCIQAISNYLTSWARKMGAKETIEVVPNGVSLDRIKNKESREKNNKRKTITIITTSRLVYKNGVDTLIKATAELCVKHRMSNIKLQILGDGPEREKLKNLAKELKVDNFIQFLGHIEPEKIYDYLAKADIFVRPSRSEGLGSSFLEAMGTGLPIIGTPVGGIPDFLKDGEMGLFCKVDDTKDLAEKIKKLMTDEEFAKRIAENGRKLVLENYSWDNVSVRMKDILNKLCVS